jgi:hypothetical protein
MRWQMKESKFPKKKDLAYWLIFLIILCVFIFTHRLADNETAVGYIGFAGTIMSLILAVLAIIYSYYQSSTYESSIKKLESSAERIEVMTNDLSEVKEFKKMFGDFKEEVNEISNGIHNLKQVVDIIDFGIKDIKSSLYDKMNKKVSKENQKTEGTDKEFSYNKNFFEDAVDNFTVFSSVVVVWLKKCHEHKVEFDNNDCTSFFLEVVMGRIQSDNEFFGFINAIDGLLIAFGQLGFFKIKKVSENKYSVIEFNSLLSEVIDKGKTQISLLDDHFKQIENLVSSKK